MQRRWFQFRLRTLLAAVVALCFALGSWQLYWTYFGPYVEAEPTAVGRPIKVRGRFFDFRGPDSTVYSVYVSKLQPDGRRVVYQSAGGRVSRRGLWAYDVEVELAPIRLAGEFQIELLPITKSLLAANKTKSRAGANRERPVVRGTIRVVAQEPAEVKP